MGPPKGARGGVARTMAARAKGGGVAGVQYALRARRDPFGLLEDLVHDQGDVATLRVAGRMFTVLNEPTLIRSVLLDERKTFTRGSVTAATDRLLGGSIVAARGPAHDRRKEAARPVSSHAHAEAVLRATAASHELTAASWGAGGVLDIQHELSVLCARVAARACVSVEDEAETERLRAMLDGAMAIYERTLQPLAALLEHLPVRRTRQVKRATNDLHAWLDAKIDERAHATAPAGDAHTGDALDILLAAGGGGGRPGSLSRDEVRGVLTDFLIASHSTIAHVVAWTLLDLAGDPETQREAAGEARAVLAGGGDPTFADLGKLVLARRCMKEGLRLHPPVWIILRRVLRDADFGGVHLPEGSYVVIAPRLTHRDERYFPEAARFRPGRWVHPAPAPEGGMTYIPFGGGEYVCSGEAWAMAQGTLALALLVRDFRFGRVGGPLPKEPAAAIQPPARVPLRVERRGAQPAA